MLDNVITFVIPIRHYSNASDWNKVISNLEGTIKSISNQSCDGWQAIVVANSGSVLPLFPPGFKLVQVDFPPNPKYNKAEFDAEAVYDAIRLDKGRRVLAGILGSGKIGHLMVVDDDDFVHCDITSFVRRNSLAPGFYIRDGYVWGDGGNWLFHYDGDFSMLCGSSNIVRSDLLSIPPSLEAASVEWIKYELGSHTFIRERLAERGFLLSPLPFIGAVYRIGHSQNHSLSSGLFQEHIFRAWLWRKPIRQIFRVFRLRYLSASFRRTYFGRNA